MFYLFRNDWHISKKKSDPDSDYIIFDTLEVAQECQEYHQEIKNLRDQRSVKTSCTPEYIEDIFEHIFSFHDYLYQELEDV